MNKNTSKTVEEAYIYRKELEAKIKAEQEQQKSLKEVEREQLKKLHYMHCPKCGMHLVEEEFKKVSVDKCSECGGIWLDDGELEMLMSLNKTSMATFFEIFKK